MKRDPLAWAALAAAIAVTASAEYALARACGFGPWVAAGVPAALDIYAVRALRARRDVLAVVVAMIGVNAASHLVTAGLIPVSVPLVVAVSAIAPLVMWRVHALREHQADGLPGAPVPADVSGIPDVPEVRTERVPAPEVHPGEVYPELPPAVPEVVPAGVRLLPIVPRPKAPVLAAEPSRTRPEVHAEYTPTPVPDGVPGTEDELTAQARVDFVVVPSIRTLREQYGIGQARAQRIRDELKGER